MAHNIGQELSSLAFDKIIGGALDAVIKAQNNSAMTTVNFIKTVGFSADASGKETPVYVQFKYPKEISPFQPAVDNKPAVEAKYQEMDLQVPILTMMPIPFIRVESTDIEFNVKINSIESSSVDTESTSSVESKTNAGYKSWWSPVNVSTSLNASLASQKKTSSTEEIKKEYSLNIKIHAVQDEIPVGMNRLLDILEESIVSLPSTKVASEPKVTTK